MPKSYNDAYKWSLYEAYQAGHTITELCKTSGITDKPLREWFRKLDQEYARLKSIDPAILHRRNSCTQTDIKNKQLELSLILSSYLLHSIEEPQRIICAQAVISKYGPNAVCRALRIRKSNLYYHMLRAPEETAYEKHNQELRPAILEICQSSKKLIGAEKIRQQLITQGFTVSKHKVLELLRELRPQHLPDSKKHKRNSKWQESDQNLLCRNFAPEAPNMVWVCDFTELKTDYGTYCLCVILDLFARRIIAARLSSYSDASLACITFRDAFQTRGQPDEVLFHTDRGAQFTSNEFRTLLRECHVVQSFSYPGVPYDNAPMESFFASLKTEEIHRFRYRNFSDLFASLQDYFNFYNYLRPHSHVKGLTPVQAEQEYFEKQNTASNESGCVPLACKKQCVADFGMQ